MIAAEAPMMSEMGGDETERAAAFTAGFGTNVIATMSGKMECHDRHRKQERLNRNIHGVVAFRGNRQSQAAKETEPLR
jgi:hypothetical protein